ncbi:Pre T-cell antigen receptor alpha [Hibiscus syriacus]|uniref:Pre T-cell antigen receptor alpha n=1 Tax=Hibiscus syriacus TaxID=106335 RepID=A0A6A2ZBZ7_HIBSY|nr:Pre T-cell antigen receptor alpha [Hibiscus syriacus]
MGCCVSTNRGSLRAKESHAQVGLEIKASAEEEEAVKEVLPETPKPKAHIFIPQQEDSEKTQIEKPKESLDFYVETEPKSPVTGEYSVSEEVSEICSVSLSESLSTVTRDEEDDEVRRQKVLRSPARSGSTNRVVGRSLNKRNGVVNGGSSARLVQVRRGPRPEPQRKDPSGSSGRHH